MNWAEAISRLHADGCSLVIVTILSVEGSSPRATQTKMVVSENGIYDTIGGGNLEFRAISKARDLLAAATPAVVREWVTLGMDLTQCCGGRVELLYECLPARNFDIVVFGAGHVGKALVKILSDLPCRVRWMDSRSEVVDRVRQEQKLPSSVRIRHLKRPDVEVEECGPNAYYLVMTHSHELDLELVQAILSRSDIHYCGLIGSKSKAAKFRNRLKRKQFSEQEIARLISPIGLSEVPGKRPMEVAVSVAAQLIALHHGRSSAAAQVRSGTVRTAGHAGA
ncbi:MAG: xanthine dehydrogenase accessory protein XdhC [Gammaproteobacteria bacterium]|nr:xanthine dehydrogenase accessory protein XdhC [Gammaproteobacteria bacterium]